MQFYTGSELLQERKHGANILDQRHILQDNGLVGEHASGQHRKGSILVARGLVGP